MSLELNRTAVREPRCLSCGTELHWWRTLEIKDGLFDALYGCKKPDCKVVTIRLRLDVDKYDSHIHQAAPTLPPGELPRMTITLDERFPIIHRN